VSIARNRTAKWLLGALAAAAWFGVLLQLWLSLGAASRSGQSMGQGLVGYLGYFTVLTNIFVAVVSSAGLLGPQSVLWSASVRGCMTTSIVLVGVTYHLLLHALWDPQGWQWVADMTLHYVIPLGSLAYWCIYPPAKPPARLAPLQWSIYPCAYFVYAVVRGRLIGSYPYFFMDVGKLGYPRTLLNAIGLLACFIAAGFAVLYVGRFRPGSSQI
jgi:hypothetical protein